MTSVLLSSFQDNMDVSVKSEQVNLKSEEMEMEQYSYGWQDGAI